MITDRYFFIVKSFLIALHELVRRKPYSLERNSTRRPSTGFHQEKRFILFPTAQEQHTEDLMFVDWTQPSEKDIRTPVRSVMRLLEIFGTL